MYYRKKTTDQFGMFNDYQWTQCKTAHHAQFLLSGGRWCGSSGGHVHTAKWGNSWENVSFKVNLIQSFIGSDMKYMFVLQNVGWIIIALKAN